MLLEALYVVKLGSMLRKIPTAYWWTGMTNFGDLLSPLLMARFADTLVQWAPAKDADLVCVGSILEALPSRWSGIVAGAGKLFPDSEVNLSRATVLGLRGPLTAKSVKGLRGTDYVLGDPGLLADELIPLPDKKYEIGLVPHWSDTELHLRFQEFNPVVIRPSGDPLEVIKTIGSCKKIVSSSLHGIVVSDAFGIPRRIELTKAFVKEGGDWKFRDHNAAVGLRHEIGLTQEAPRYRVQDKQHELFDLFSEVGRRLSRS